MNTSQANCPISFFSAVHIFKLKEIGFKPGSLLTLPVCSLKSLFSGTSQSVVFWVNRENACNIMLLPNLVRAIERTSEVLKISFCSVHVCSDWDFRPWLLSDMIRMRHCSMTRMWKPRFSSSRARLMRSCVNIIVLNWTTQLSDALKPSSGVRNKCASC